MFIAWRSRPIVGDKVAPIMTDRRNLSGDRWPWAPLYCEHRGAGRVAWTPLVMQAGRVEGRPRQKLLERWPTIRSCCIADPFIRAAWWWAVEWSMAGWAEVSISPMCDLLARDRPAMMRALRAKVPRPTPEGLARFTELRERREHEARELLDAWFAEQRHEQERARKAEAERMQDDLIREDMRRRERERQERERDRKRRDAWDAFQATFWPDAGGPVGASPSLAALGLGAGATLEDVKRRYRELAKVHHPDRGGDAAEFNRIRAAYGRAVESFGVGA